jgi:hypothetical protein
MTRSRLAAACGLCAALLLLPACGSSAPTLAAGPGSVVVDGEASDWQGALHPVEDAPLTIGVRSDAEHVYVAVVTSDRGVVRHTLLTGLTVWLDAAGGKGTDFGVRFPLGTVRDGQLPDLGDLRGARQPTDRDQSARLEAMTREIGIVQEGTLLTLDRAAATGIRAGATLEGGTLVVELAVPLAFAEGAPFAVGARAGSTIGVGVENPQLDREALRAQMQARGGSEQMRRGGQGRGRAMRGGQGAERVLPQPVEVWVRAQLQS